MCRRDKKRVRRKMASTTTLRISITLSNKEPFSVSNPTRTTLTNYFLSRQQPSRSLGISFSSRRREKAITPSVTSKKINKKKTTQKDVGEDENVDEDAFEALFRLLEEDLKNDELNVNGGGDDEISEEELAKLEQELAEALEDDELFGAFQSATRGETNNEEDEEEDDDDDEEGSEVDDENEEEEEEEEMPIKLKNWQLRRLAYALKTGRRKTSIKSLSAELCLDRAVVLKILRDPPPNLVMLSAALPDKPAPIIVEPVEELEETVQVETMTTDVPKSEDKMKVPVHVMQSNWSARKRLKKVQVETLEQVYRRTKRPTNAMISSIVHVTNLPRKKVVKWFEDKRGEEGVPEHRVPYQRSDPEPSVFAS